MYVFWVPGLRYLGLSTWATTGNPDTQAIGGNCVYMYVSMYVCMFVYVYVFWVPGLKYLSLGTWATGNLFFPNYWQLCMYVCMYSGYLGLGT